MDLEYRMHHGKGRRLPYIETPRLQEWYPFIFFKKSTETSSETIWNNPIPGSFKDAFHHLGFGKADEPGFETARPSVTVRPAVGADAGGGGPDAEVVVSVCDLDWNSVLYKMGTEPIIIEL